MRARVCLLALFVIQGCGGSGTAGKPPAAPPSNEGPPAAAPGGSGTGAGDGGCMPVPWKDEHTAGEATYRGTIIGVEAGLPNGTTENVLVLNLERPACLPEGATDDKQTDAVQIYSPDDKLHAQLEAQRDKQTTVTVTGEGFLSHTAHHHRPIVVDVKRVTVK